MFCNYNWRAYLVAFCLFFFLRMTEDMKLTDLELGRVANSIQELLYNASDICHDRCVKFLLARAKVIHKPPAVLSMMFLLQRFASPQKLHT